MGEELELLWRKIGEKLIERYKSLHHLFVSRIHKTEDCWIWLGKPRRDGYGLEERPKNSIILCSHRSEPSHFGSEPNTEVSHGAKHLSEPRRAIMQLP